MALFRMAYVDTQQWLDLGEQARDRAMAAMRVADLLAAQIRLPDVIEANGQRFGRYGPTRTEMLREVRGQNALRHYAYLEDRSMAHDFKQDCLRYQLLARNLLAGAHINVSAKYEQGFPIINQSHSDSDPQRLIGAEYAGYDPVRSILYLRSQEAHQVSGPIREVTLLTLIPDGGSPYAFQEAVTIESVEFPEQASA